MINRAKHSGLILLVCGVILLLVFNLPSLIVVADERPEDVVPEPRIGDIVRHMDATDEASDPLFVSADDALQFGGQVVHPEGIKSRGRYAILLQDPPVSTYRGGIADYMPTAATEHGDSQLRVMDPHVQAYANYLREQQQTVERSVEGVLGRQVATFYRWQYALNGIVVDLLPSEAERVARLPHVWQVVRDDAFYPQTDYGPGAINANRVWQGDIGRYDLVASLSAADGVPTPASGEAELSYNFINGELFYDLTLTNIISPTHIEIYQHDGDTIVLTLAAGRQVSDTIQLDDDEQAAFYTHLLNLNPTLDRGLYINVASNAYPSGEIRGDIRQSGTLGDGVVVGIFDTGINMDHPSFAAIGPLDGFIHQNPRGSGVYVGMCDPNHPAHDPAYPCNDKLIGVWDYADASWDNEADGPEDNDGHGSHTASTAAGNMITATVYNYTTTTAPLYESPISGIAPHANIISYDVCGPEVCNSTDVVAAMEQAILDGVQVTNESIGIGGNTFTGLKQVAYLNLIEAGIVPVRSAGNEGPEAKTVNSEPPWAITVAAVTHDRRFEANKRLTNLSGGDSVPPDTIIGRGISDRYGPATIVYAGAYGDSQCLAPFAANTFSGEIVICDRGENSRVAKGENVLAGGAGGMILTNIPDGATTLNSDRHVLPAIHIGAADGDALKAWVTSGNGHIGVISATTAEITVESDQADIMAEFSSRGPAVNDLELLKPDVAAPGFQILAAYSAIDLDGLPEYEFLNGTSMASPHVAGAAVLLRSEHPEWTPSEIRSALMSTAFTAVRQEDGSTAADAFDIGAGRINVESATRVGLVMNETIANYQASNPDDGGEPRSLNLPSMQDNQCVGRCRWTRTLTNISGAPVTYTASINGLSGSVSPAVFTLENGETIDVNVSVDVSDKLNGEFAFGSLLLQPERDNLAQQKLPIVVLPMSSNIPDYIHIHARRDQGSDLLTNMQSKGISHFTYTVAGPALASQVQFNLPQVSSLTTESSDLFFVDEAVAVYTKTVDSGTRLLIAEVTGGEALDIGIWLGYDADGDGEIKATEGVCVSVDNGLLERCQQINPAPGLYEIRVINLESVAAGSLDLINLSLATVSNDNAETLFVTAPITVSELASFDIRYRWVLSSSQNSQDTFPNYYAVVRYSSTTAQLGDLGESVVRIDRLSDDVIKTADRLEASLGQTVTYQIVIEPNSLRQDLNYAVTDVLPNGLQLLTETVTATAGIINTHDQMIEWTGMQPTQIDAIGNYHFTTSVEDPACIDPVTGSTYINLADFGLAPNPSISGDSFFWGYTWDIGLYEEAPIAPTFSTDGLAIFQPFGGVTASHDPIPTTAIPNGLIAAYWRDLIVEYNEIMNQGVTAGVAGDFLIVEFDDAFVKGAPNQKLDFQMAFWLGEPDPRSGTYDIFLAYDNVTITSTVGTVGVENEDGTVGTEIGFNEITPFDGLMFCLDYVLQFEPITITYQAVVTAVDPVPNTLHNTVVHSTDNPASQPVTTTHQLLVQDEPSAGVRFVHVSPFVNEPTGLDLYLDNQLVYSNLSYGSTTGFLTPIQAGIYDLTIRRAGTTLILATMSDLMLAPGEQKTILVRGGANGHMLGAVELAPPEDSEQSMLLFFHLAPFAVSDLETVVSLIDAENNSLLLPPQSYGQNGHIRIDNNMAELRLEDRNNEIDLALLPITSFPNTYTTIIFAGDGLNQPYEVYELSEDPERLVRLAIKPPLFLPLTTVD